MSVSQLENRIKSLQVEIERLSKELETETKNEARYNTALNRTMKSITKHTSPSMLKSKQRSIDSDTEKIRRSQKKQTEIQEKISKKKVELTKKQSDLQKERNKVYQDMTMKQENILAEQRNFVSQTNQVGNHMEVAVKEYDFFISHATEDKETVAEPLAHALIDKGAKVWLDKFAMSVGDSLRASIDQGLAHSRYGIVILSEIYFKKFWTGKELNGLFAKQEEGNKVILPVWHNISKDTVKQYSPILADMLALKTADFTIEELADEFIKLI